MNINYYKIFKIDNVIGSAQLASFENMDNIENYVMNILNKCASASAERRYKYRYNNL